MRLRVALALADGKEKDAVPALIDLLDRLPAAQAGVAEDLLGRLAGPDAPAVPPERAAAGRRKVRDVWAGWWRDHEATVDFTRLDTLGYTLIVLLDERRIFELDAAGQVRWQLDGFSKPLDAQLLPNDHLLVAEHGGDLGGPGNRVTERTLKGELVWKKDVDGPLVAQRLPGGNTFIATADQLFEVDPDGKELYVITRPGGEAIMKAQKLRDGDIACVTTPPHLPNSSSAQRFVRLDTAGKEILSFPVSVGTSGGRIDVLPNGNVVVPEKELNRVVEYDPAGRVVWQAKAEQPVAAVRLPNGNTLVTSFTQLRAIEIDRTGRREVWEYKDKTRVTRAFRR